MPPAGARTLVGARKAEIGWISSPEDVRHGAGQNALCVGNSGNDARNEIVLQLEESIRAERALVILGPKMGARDAIHKLDGQAQLRTCLAQAAFHHVARAEFVAGGANIDSAL